MQETKIDWRPTRRERMRVASRLGLRALGMLALLGFSTSCQTTAREYGNLTVPFVLGNWVSCDDAGIAYVQAVLDGDVENAQVVDCDQGEIYFTDLPAGGYSVVIYGYSSETSASETPVMDSLASPEVYVDVAGNASVSDMVFLTAAPVELRVRWQWDYISCENADVSFFEIKAWTADALSPLLTQQIPCDTDETDFDKYRLVPDPDRDLKGNIIGQVSVTPYREDGRILGNREGAKFVFSPPASGETVRLTVSCGDYGCEGSGSPD